ncbi:mpv17-like protein isoform X1 [Ptychodera flava]|uniref:mpv17-like protein isoform X1 n=1 Tax=Ptychodera flava TaxID=63121 RepID=UPI00396A44AB
MAFNLLRRIGRSYLVRNSVFFSVVYSLSEYSQQTIIGDGHDVETIKRYGKWGILEGGRTYVYFRILDWLLPGTAVRTIVKKVVIDIAMTPVFVSSFYIAMSAMEGKYDLFAEAKEKTIPTCLAGITIWTPLQAINFKFVSPKFRGVYTGSVYMLWANTLCLLKRMEVSTESV